MGMIALGISKLQLGLFAWWADSELLDPHAITAAADQVVHDPTFSDAMAPLIAGRLVATVPIDSSVAEPVVARALDDPDMADGLVELVSAAARSSLDYPVQPVSIPLETLHRRAIVELGLVDPSTALLLAAAGPAPPLTLDTDTGILPDLSGADRWAERVWTFALPLATAAIIGSVVIHPSPARALRRAGIALTVAGGIWMATGWVFRSQVLGRLPEDGLAAVGSMVLDHGADGLLAFAIGEILIGLTAALAGHLWLWYREVLGPVLAPGSPAHTS